VPVAEQVALVAVDKLLFEVLGALGRKLSDEYDFVQLVKDRQDRILDWT
jgi:hypothetical protein